MSRHPIKVLADGTHVYSNGTKYKPKSLEERKYAIRKPDVEGAILYQGIWFLPLDLLPLEERTWPETRPDTDAYEHASKPRRCKCDVCRRPESRRWRNQWRREQRSLTA